jgi:hypothetical protein
LDFVADAVAGMTLPSARSFHERSRRPPECLDTSLKELPKAHPAGVQNVWKFQTVPGKARDDHAIVRPTKAPAPAVLVRL